MSARSRASLPRPMMAQAAAPAAVSPVVLVSGSQQSWYGGMTNTTKIVLAVIMGIAIVFLLSWLLCPAYRHRDGEYHHRHRDASWSGSSEDNDDEIKLVVISPSPTGAPAPATGAACLRYRDNCGWSGSEESHRKRC